VKCFRTELKWKTILSPASLCGHSITFFSTKRCAEYVFSVACREGFVAFSPIPCPHCPLTAYLVETICSKFCKFEAEDDGDSSELMDDADIDDDGEESINGDFVPDWFGFLTFSVFHVCN
jgi:hypothetical protein